MNVTERPFPKDTIIQVEVYSNTSEIWLHREKALQDMYNRMHNRHYIEDFERRSRRRSAAWIRDYCGSSFFINLTGTNFFCQLILTELAKTLGNIAKDMHSTVTGGGAAKSEGSTVVEDGVTIEDTSEEDSGNSSANSRDIEGVGTMDTDGNITTMDGVTTDGVTTDGVATDGVTEVEGANTHASGVDIRNEDKRTMGGRTSYSTATTTRMTFYDVIFRRSTSCNTGHVNLHAKLFYSKNYTLYDLFEFYSK